MKNFLYVSAVFLCLFFASCDLSNKTDKEDKDFIDKIKQNNRCISKKFYSEEKSMFYLVCSRKDDKKILDNKLILEVHKRVKSAYKELQEKMIKLEINKKD
jgi:hypothetical protein